MRIVPMTDEHADAVLDVYAEGIATRSATFETQVPGWATWDAAHLPTLRLVAEDDARVLGWVAASPTSSRCVYAGVVEVSLYVAAAARGRGVGAALLGRFVEASEAAGIWTVRAGIFPENAASLALHSRHGFRVVGTQERVGCLDGVWKDVVLLERRSTVVGTDEGTVPAGTTAS
ncbi:GNAT family N-acetyltransferase [Sanguibacter suaedae]|uniref:N-acetyltransferase n=1 Tax=Sanguibacter suaedae TaxID=2795737 RepID=A0A934I0Q7_9MICO|nr:GNAT family N-acetyltransferase [Sanguibacter suaedae]MBI9113434.1 N-acetyltransferase [Sanguibacter suaedae]